MEKAQLASLVMISVNPVKYVLRPWSYKGGSWGGDEETKSQNQLPIFPPPIFL